MLGSSGLMTKMTWSVVEEVSSAHQNSPGVITKKAAWHCIFIIIVNSCFSDIYIALRERGCIHKYLHRLNESMVKHNNLRSLKSIQQFDDLFSSFFSQVTENRILNLGHFVPKIQVRIGLSNSQHIYIPDIFSFRSLSYNCWGTIKC